ncbi:L-fucose/L-arabinose isomerase family protein [Pseudothermotoga sp.]|nr:L-fucose/L-arabinose isomerase family protein [Pseudothermotoga sp.]MCX7812476.1 L-fucose/L-arabinose isomerase family protein [Pseudothermotoga sp.]MDW8140070.1 L-fucose/L-arabinose isomerase family protein [Pseudothermotoga sp.]
MKRKVGLLTFSDGRDYVSKELIEINKKFERILVEALESTQEIEVVKAERIVDKPSVAKEEALRIRNEGAQMTIFHYAVWAFPHFSVIASKFAPGPFLLFGNVNPKYPGMVGMLAAAGALEQDGTQTHRVWGDVREPHVLKKVMSFVRAATARNLLKGQRYGLFGGRSMGMYTAVPNVDLWNKMFGIDVEHIDQLEIVEKSKKVSESDAKRAREWLEKHVKKIHYDGKQLTPEKLELQIKSYYALKRISEELELDFIGVKAQPELTEHFVTMDVAEAFLNDPYDWDGPKEPLVCATEADSDGALTMQIFKLISNQPVLFADVRHYDSEDNFFDLCNSGQHATFFAARSYDPAVNLAKVEFYPESFYFPAGGASVRHIAAPGEVTLARLTRKNGRYVMNIIKGEFLDFGECGNEEKARVTQIEWPHAFARLKVSVEEFLSTYSSNHIHGVYGDYVEELVHFCKLTGIDFSVHV